jgi:hypothetical protein
MVVTRHSDSAAVKCSRSAQSKQHKEQNPRQCCDQPKNGCLLVFVRQKPDKAEQQTNRDTQVNGQPAKGCNGRASAGLENRYDGKSC